MTGQDDSDVASFRNRVAGTADPLTDGDLQLALACCYELSYGGFTGCDLDEWEPALLELRRPLEAAFEDAVRTAVPPVATDLLHLPVHDALRRLVDEDHGPALSTYVLRDATREQVQDLLAQKSVYQLREADPHTWAIPRLRGPAKAALVEIQADEYGGRWTEMHSTLFARAMRGVGLDDEYGAYWDRALPQTFAAMNRMSLLALHRRLRGAVVGHLAVLEMTSTAPMRRYANGLRRLGYSDSVTGYFDEHVEADAVHEQVVAVDLCGAFVPGEPAPHADLLWGARGRVWLRTARWPPHCSTGGPARRRWRSRDHIARRRHGVRHPGEVGRRRRPGRPERLPRLAVPPRHGHRGRRLGRAAVRAAPSRLDPLGDPPQAAGRMQREGRGNAHRGSRGGRRVRDHRG